MNQSQKLPSPGFNLVDIYHVLFRHKKKILFIWIVGLVAAVVLWQMTPVTYVSNAKLLIKYVPDTKPLNPVPGADPTPKPSTDGDGVINAELEMLTSYDLALEVARLVGPEKILSKAGGGNDLHLAAGIVGSGLKPESSRGSPVISISFRNADRTIVKQVLDQVITNYNKMEFETHLKPGGSLDEFLDQQIVDAKNELKIKEQELRAAMLKVNVISLPETEKAQAEGMRKILDNLYNDQAEMAGSIARLSLMTNRMSGTTAVDTNSPAPITIAKDIQERYRRVCALLDTYEKEEMRLQHDFLPDSQMLRGIHETIVNHKALKAELETQYPALAESRVAESVNRGQAEFSPGDLVGEMAKIKSLEARIGVHNEKLAQLRKEALAVNDAKGDIEELQRTKKLLEDKLNYFISRQDRNRFDDKLGPGRISNIVVIQSPTPPYKDLGKLAKKLFAIIAGAFAGAIGLAFSIELYFDRSIKRPLEVEGKTGLPLFLSIPRAKLNGAARLNGIQHPSRLLAAGGDHGKNGSPAEQPNGGSTALVPHKQDHLQPFFEALRDRLIMSFEMRNLVHKPKLVAVTSCGPGAGVSTIASGLAASLSETGDGNVLLVDMNEVGQGAAHYFHKGKLECGLDDALETEKRESAMVQDNLYVVSEKPANGVPRVLHKRFSSLLPKLKASDYDYIIFDMPPVSQISPTSKLARYMDMVFMVVEAEKTSHESIQRATSLLEESKAHVGVVLNKSRNYVPKRLQ